MTILRKNIMLGTAGHVDHGKTSLVKLLTGCDTDTLAAEKRRGLTIEVGFAPCRLADERIVGVVDVPGHADFIRNMVAGAHGVDVVILVVAADDGVMPQTREHLDILTFMGVRHGLVALTKIDLVDPMLREMAVEDVSQLLEGTFLENAPICPLSNITGEGFDGFFDALNRQVDGCAERSGAGLFRMWIGEAFGVHGFGPVASGIPSTGQVHIEDHLRLLPADVTGRVRRLEVYAQEAEVGRAGECVAVNLTNIEPALLTRGSVLCQGESFESVTMFEAELHLLASLPHPLKDYAEVHLHVGTAEVMAHVALLEDKQLSAGQKGLAQLRLAQPLGVAAGDRFVIRGGMADWADGRVTTLGGGRIVGTGNVRLRRQRAWTTVNLTARAAALDDLASWCEAILAESATALTLPQWALAVQKPTIEVESVIPGLRSEGKVFETGGLFVHATTIKSVCQRMATLLSEFHAANPLRLGMPEADLLAALGVVRGLFDLALEASLRDGSVLRNGPVLVLAGCQARLKPEDLDLCRRIEELYQTSHLASPRPTEAAGTLGQSVPRVDAMIRLLADAGTLIVLDHETVMHRQAVEAGKKAALDLFSKTSSFTTMQFRDALGVSRKHVIPLLDYFDRIRLTVRNGSQRTPGALARPPAPVG